MPYKDSARQREAQRRWIALRRAQYLVGKSCVDCGSTEDLEFDHIDKAAKTSHRIWSWAKTRLEAELAKCVVRCDHCHNERHAAEKRQAHGTGAYKRGCRCAICRAANTEKNRRYLEKRRERDLHPRERLCRPSPSSSAIAPQSYHQPSLFDQGVAA